MKKKLLIYANVLLGAASLTLAGCHTQKKAVAPETQSQEQTVGEAEEPAQDMPERPIMVKYGIPPQLR